MTTHQSTRQVVGALIRKSHEILLVQEQGREDAAPHWSVPGGVVEVGELLHEALAREVREETGLEVHSLSELAYVVQFDNPTRHQGHETQGRGFSYTVFVFEIEEWSGELGESVSGDVVSDSQFLPIPDAITKFEELRFRVMREPLIAYLRQEVAPGAMWLYRRDEDGGDSLVVRLPGLI